MPACETPPRECQTFFFTFCYFSEYDGLFEEVPEGEEPPCLPFYLTKIVTESQTDTYSFSLYGAVTDARSIDYSIATTRTLPTIGPCVEDVSCVISGTCSEVLSTYGYTETTDGVTTWVTGPFVSYSKTATLSNYAGLPNPLWVPGEDETEEDRPLCPGPCYPMWAGEYKIYEPVFGDPEHPERQTGSTLASTTPLYSTSGAPINTAAWGGADVVTTFDDQIECVDFYDAAIAATAAGDLDWFDAVDCVASIGPCNDCNHQFPNNADNEWPAATAIRYRWRVPPCHPGSWYRIDWDEVFFPQAYLDWLSDAQADPDGIEQFDPNADPPPELPTITPKSWTWTGTALGPCDPEDEENNYDYRYALPERISPWSLPLIPPAPGTMEILNARVTCYRNPFGSKPQLVNDALGIGNYSPDDVDRDGILDEEEPIPEPEP
jgi:hypothetical protein